VNEKQHIFIFERGVTFGLLSVIASMSGDWGVNWPNKAIVNIHKNTPCKAQTLLYATIPLLAALTRRWRARQLGKLLTAYKGCKIHIVGHSEGTATVLEALRLLDWPEVETLHLVCGACDSNYERNGLNFALRHNRIEKVFVYVADKDNAMKWEDTIIGLLMFGISWNDLPLGLSGAKNVAQGLWDTRVIQSHWERYGHSDCWTPHYFDSTMLQIIGNSRAMVNVQSV
jgi:pimeloyl-ACP methyl ester carboxylesterase